MTRGLLLLGFAALIALDTAAQLERAPIGAAFAASDLDIVTVLPMSHWVFGERIGWPQTLGGALIVADVSCLAVAAGLKPRSR